VQSLLHFRLNITILVPHGKSVKQPKSHIFKGSKNGVKNNFLDYFLNKGVLGTHVRSCAEFVHFRLNITIVVPPGKSVKQAKSHIFKRSKNGVKNYFLDFFLNKGVLGTHERGCAEFAPILTRNKI